MKSNYNSRKIKPLSEIFSDQMFLTFKPIITFYIYELVLHGKLATYTAGNPIYSFERLTDDELKRLTSSPNLSVEIFTIKIPTDEFKKIIRQNETDINKLKSKIYEYSKHKEMWHYSQK